MYHATCPPNLTGAFMFWQFFSVPSMAVITTQVVNLQSRCQVRSLSNPFWSFLYHTIHVRLNDNT